MTAVQHRLMTVDEYIQFELHSELRHEFINGQLFEMPREIKLNQRIATFLTVFFFSLLEDKGYSFYSHDMKVAITGEKRYYYPDFVLTKEPDTRQNDYIQYEPELIAEIISKTSRIRDTVDKYLDYTKIPSLKYYLIIEPERMYVTVHSREESSQWDTEVYSEKTDIIPLPLLQTELPLSIIYK